MGALEAARTPNFCPQGFAQLSTTTRRALRRVRRRPSLIAAFWRQADLFASQRAGREQQEKRGREGYQARSGVGQHLSGV